MEYYFPVANITSEINYPYTQSKNACSANAQLSPKYLAATPSAADLAISHGNINKDESALIAKINIGPVAVVINSSCGSFSSYSSGIFSAPGCNAKSVDHAVLVVGYGHDLTLCQNYW
jgi:hypothetical protein